MNQRVFSLISRVNFRSYAEKTS